MSKKFGLSTHSPLILVRLFTARRIFATEVPAGVERSSGARVRLPTRMTRLMSEGTDRFLSVGMNGRRRPPVGRLEEARHLLTISRRLRHHAHVALAEDRE